MSDVKRYWSSTEGMREARGAPGDIQGAWVRVEDLLDDVRQGIAIYLEERGMTKQVAELAGKGCATCKGTRWITSHHPGSNEEFQCSCPDCGDGMAELVHETNHHTPEGFTEIGQLVAEEESTPEGLARMNAARLRLATRLAAKQGMKLVPDDSRHQSNSKQEAP